MKDKIYFSLKNSIATTLLDLDYVFLL